MKYSENNKPLVCMQTQSTCYTGTSFMDVKGILWHSTGANNPNLRRYVQPSDNATDRDEWLKLLGVNNNKNDWNHVRRQAGLNCWIGKMADGSVATVQTMPWDYKPWGCGSGPKGSCNNGWIQFEICEDDLNNKDYFNEVYNEACEITAYLCKKFNIDPNGFVEFNGVKVPTILCHADSYKLGLGSNHGDIYNWFPKFGKDMETVRKDVSEIMGINKIETESNPEYYRIRKSWNDSKSQIGAYKDLDLAKKACDKAGSEYNIYDNNGVKVYSPKVEASFNVGDLVKLLPNATYTSGIKIPSWVFKNKLYVREIRKNGDVVISTQKSGAVTGVVKPTLLAPYANTSTVKPSFEPYLIKVNVDLLNIRAGAGTKYRIVGRVKRNEVYTIIEENGSWGKLKSGAGWIYLDYTKKI